MSDEKQLEQELPHATCDMIIHAVEAGLAELMKTHEVRVCEVVGALECMKCVHRDRWINMTLAQNMPQVIMQIGQGVLDSLGTEDDEDTDKPTVQ